MSIGGAALYGAAYSSKSLWAAFLPIFLPFSILWSLFCYGAYKGLVGTNALLKVVFWLFVLGHVVGFPVARPLRHYASGSGVSCHRLPTATAQASSPGKALQGTMQLPRFSGHLTQPDRRCEMPKSGPRK